MAESRFPMFFDECPLCKSQERVASLGWDEEVAAGRAALGTPVGSQIFVLPLYDPIKPPVFQCGALFIRKDICASCGHERVVSVEYKVLPVDQIPGLGAPPPGMGTQ